MNQGKYKHSDEERCIFGTWVVDEIRKAAEMSFSVMDVFEYWQYEATCFYKDTNTGGLFAGYVNMF